MALLKTREIRGMEAEARMTKLRELQQELMHERGVAAMGGAPPSPGKIRALRKNVARILTVLSEEERSKTISPPPAPEATPRPKRSGTTRRGGKGRKSTREKTKEEKD